jgi:hypothetical protein
MVHDGQQQQQQAPARASHQPGAGGHQGMASRPRMSRNWATGISQVEAAVHRRILVRALNWKPRSRLLCTSSWV